MKSGKRLAAPTCILAFAFLAPAELSQWVQHQPVGPLLDALLRSMPMPGGPVRFHRPPSESRPALTTLIDASPKNGTLYRLRAQEAEMQLDFTAAESDWRAAANLAGGNALSDPGAGDRGEAYLALADFYHRRAKAAEETGALDVVGRLPSDPFLPVQEQRSWRAYARMLQVIQEAGLPDAAGATAFRSWIARYPREEGPRRDFITFLESRKQYLPATAQIAAYTQTFPQDNVYPVEARANLAASRDTQDAALRLYDQAFQPLWPKPLLDAYFALLEKNGQLRDFEGRARAAHQKAPDDINTAARLFAYYQHTGNVDAARRALIEFRLTKESHAGGWTPAELKVLAGLFERLPDVNEQARAYYALYSAVGATAGDREAALAGMTTLLLNHAEQAINFGAGDLSLYKDIGTADSSPGFLNGILSLVLNSTSPRWQYQEQNSASASYFHRAEGARLLQLLETQFPASPHRASLRSSLVDAYASYGDDDGVITTARSFLAAFPAAGERTHVAVALADALSRHKRTQEEFAVYRQMLTELAAHAGGVPLGVHGGGVEPVVVFPRQPADIPGGERETAPGEADKPRSADYALVLDRYLSRVASVGQPMEALRVYRAELARNPNDPGLYERFASFLMQNNVGADVQDVYRRAIARFPDKTWYHQLARWYLRAKQQSAFAALSREVSGIFSGTELEAYFRDVVRRPGIGPALYLQLNLYAHQRFPEDLAFVQNLLTAYRAPATANDAAATALLHDFWFYDAELKREYFEKLSSEGQLVNQIAALRKDNQQIQNGQWPQLALSNPAASRFAAEAEAWLGHFEAAAPALKAVADLYPGWRESDDRAASLYRSLAWYFPADTALAVNFAQRASESDPRDTRLLETVGDIYSDKDQFVSAAVPWNRIPLVFGGKPDGYLEAATVFWDYYRFDDALRLIRQARVKYRDDTLYAYEAGAIEEGRRDYTKAASEYLAGAEHGNEAAQQRIVKLASRPAQRDLLYRMTANASPALRIEILKAQQRRPELEAFLGKEIAVATQSSDVPPLVDAAREQGFEPEVRQGLEREIAVTPDPVERIRLRIDLIRYLEDHKDSNDLPAAIREMEALSRDNPMVLGVVRARIDFDKRNKREDDAIATLTQAAGRSRADLSARFRFEAAGLATAAGHVEQARTLLSELLKSDPLNAGYLAGMAETYVATADDPGFLRFTASEIETLKRASLPAGERNTRVAALRRRLIVTLARRNDYAGAVDQYIEVINQYPEDETVAREAALFAAAHQRTEQLIGFYRKTIASAPRDWRWPVVLARIDTSLEDYPAALAFYETAIKTRPDRADLVMARAQLEERLLRFEDAIRSYSRLYELTYHDPHWLDKSAEFQARLGHAPEAAATLEQAHIGIGGETVTGLFDIAEKLEQWHLHSDAARYAQRGFTLAGSDIWTKYPGALSVYARIMAESRHPDALLTLKAINDESGVRKQEALQAAGGRIAELYSPEEKASLAPKVTSADLSLSESAGFEDNVAAALRKSFLAEEQAGSGWIPLQSRRGLYEELSRDLEAMGTGRIQTALGQAAIAAANTGDTESELRIYGKLLAAGQLPQHSWNRYFALLLDHNPPALATLAASGRANLNDSAVNFAIAHGDATQSFNALRSRSRALPPVWLAAYTALTGTYFDDHAPPINQAFLASLHPQTIGQRLASKPDPNRSLTGSIWFYYGERYGEYLTRGNNSAAADYLPSELEQHPGDPQVFISLARFYSNSTQPLNAITAFREALDLDPDLGEAHDGIARALIGQNRRADAIAEWRESLAAFEREQSRGVRVRETFWKNVTDTIDAIADAKVFPELRPEIHRLLAGYVHINGAYRVDELITAALRASFASRVGFDWIFDILLQTDTGDINFPGLNFDDRERLERLRLEYVLRQTALAHGSEKARLGQQTDTTRTALIDLLLAAGKPAEALTEWHQFSPSDLNINRRQRVWLEIRLAGATSGMDALLARYRSMPDNAPDIQQLLAAATTLRGDGHTPAALSILEFAYSRELEARHLDIANFMGLARVLLERGNSQAQAISTLRRMTLVAGEPFEAFEPAGDLLVEFHQEAAAAEFFARALHASPWNSSSRLKLARISNISDRQELVASLIEDSSAPYQTRARAAVLIAPARPSATGELALLSSGDKSAVAARKPFFVESRIQAAENTPDVQLRLALLREALAIDPADRTVRIAAVRAALGAGKDDLALAMFSANVNLPRYFPSMAEPVVGNEPRLLELISAAARRAGNLGAALNYLEQAIALGTSPADRAHLEQKRAAIQAEQKRREDNQQRQPTISAHLEQLHIVRPRELP